MNPRFPCVRCHQHDYKVISSGAQCKNCGMNHFVSEVISFTFDNYDLYWRVDGTCALYIRGEKIDAILLPNLPYDITKEQLELYLTFS